MKIKFYAVVVTLLSFLLTQVAHAGPAGKTLMVPTMDQVRTNQITVDSQGVWYHVYTTSPGANFLSFHATPAGELKKMRIVNGDTVVFTWSSSSPSEGLKGKVRLNDLEAWKKFFKEKVAMPPFNLELNR